MGRIERTVSVHPEHENAVRAFNDFAVRNTKRCLVLAAILAVAMVPLDAILIFVDPHWGVFGFAVAVAGLGILVLRFPFATPETIKLFGIRTAIRLVRSLGILLLLMALGLLAMLKWI